MESNNTITLAGIRDTGQRENIIYGDDLVVFRNVMMSEPKADLLIATITKDQPYDGKTTKLQDWKWDKESGTISIRGAIYYGHGEWVQINGTFPARLLTVDLKAPGRNWTWSNYSIGWHNSKTGERRRAF